MPNMKTRFIVNRNETKGIKSNPINVWVLYKYMCVRARVCACVCTLSIYLSIYKTQTSDFWLISPQFYMSALFKNKIHSLKNSPNRTKPDNNGTYNNSSI